MADEILVTDDGPVRRIALNRPQARNAQNAALLRALEAACLDTARTESVRVVIHVEDAESWRMMFPCPNVPLSRAPHGTPDGLTVSQLAS